MKWIKWLVIGVLTAPVLSSAATVLKSYKWLASNQFELVVEIDGKPVAFLGTVSEAEAMQVRTEGITASLKVLDANWIAIAIGQDQQTLASVFLLNRQNGSWTLQNPNEIRGKRATVMTDLNESLAALQRLKKWEINDAIHAALNYFKANPSRTLTDFYDQVELNNIRTTVMPPTHQRIIPPVTRVSPPPRTPPADEPPQQPISPRPGTTPPVTTPGRQVVQPTEIKPGGASADDASQSPQPAAPQPRTGDGYQPDLRAPRYYQPGGNLRRQMQLDDYFKRNFGDEGDAAEQEQKQKP